MADSEVHIGSIRKSKQAPSPTESQSTTGGQQLFLHVLSEDDNDAT